VTDDGLLMQATVALPSLKSFSTGLSSSGDA